MSEESPRPETLPPGYDEENPYEGEDLSTYPEWWRRNIEEFRSHGMRPYRPPRFMDGRLTPPVIADLEDELKIDIHLRAISPHEENGRELLIDSEKITNIKCHREGEGFSVYQITSKEFALVVRDVVEGA